MPAPELDRNELRRYVKAFDCFYAELKVEPDQSGYQEWRTINQRVPGAQCGATYRDDVLKSDGWSKTSARQKLQYPRCWVCQSRSQLRSHHMTYERVTREEEGDLLTLCQFHHDRVHVLSMRDEYKKRSYAWILAKIAADRLVGICTD